jgi:hypothetical protein
MRDLLRGLAFCMAALAACAPAGGEDLYLRSPGALGVAYVGLYYGLVDPGTGTWYAADSFADPTSTVRVAVADTGCSPSILGKFTQEACIAAGTGVPMQPYPDVEFLDEGLDGQVSLMVTDPLQLMIADFKAAEEAADPEDPGLYTAYGPAGPVPPEIKMAAALEPIGGGVLGIDFDVIGMSAMQSQLLYVDPHYRRTFRFFFEAMAGSLERPAPPPDHPRALYLPITMHDFFNGQPQTADVGPNPVLPVHIRKAASDPFATRPMAAFDLAGSNFISESFAVEAGVDLNSPPDLTILVSGIGPDQTERPGWYVDALALDLGGDREGDQLIITHTAVFVIPDAEMPAGLEAILGNVLFSPGITSLSDDTTEETSLLEWYVDMRDPGNACIILVPAKPGDANFDDAVDGLDYNTWSLHYQMTGMTWAEANFNTDDTVDGLDYNVWSLNYEGGSGAVPGPATLSLLAMGACLPLLRRRR